MSLIHYLVVSKMSWSSSQHGTISRSIYMLHLTPISLPITPLTSITPFTPHYHTSHLFHSQLHHSFPITTHTSHPTTPHHTSHFYYTTHSPLRHITPISLPITPLTPYYYTLHHSLPVTTHHTKVIMYYAFHLPHYIAFITPISQTDTTLLIPAISPEAEGDQNYLNIVAVL